MRVVCFVGVIVAFATLGCGGTADTTDDAATHDAAAIDAASPTDAATAHDVTESADAATAPDAVESPDAPTPSDAAPSPDTGPVVCGAASRPDLGITVQNSQGLVVARDGTMYFAQPGGIGRRLPDGTLDTHWVMISGSSVFLGMTLDATNETLFAVALGSGATSPTMFRIVIATRVPTPILTGAFPVDVTLGPDGMLYYTENSLSAVMRMSASGGPATRVTIGDLMSPTGLAFETAGTLIVAESYLGRLHRVTLSAAGVETARAMVTFFSDPRGVALDGRGRIYVTSGFGHLLVQMDPDGTHQVALSSALGGGPQFFDFGHGALCATDVFVAQGTIVRVMTDTPGAAVPWH
jgi:streptogramin lyase